MATKKAGKKSTKKKTTGSSKTKPSGKSPGAKPGRKKKKLAPGQEPIIIGGGGSVHIEFEKTFKKKLHASKEKFGNDIVDLRKLVIVPGDGTTPKEITLFKNDTVYICYSGSSCPGDDES